MTNNKGFTLVPLFLFIFPRVTSVNLEPSNVYKSNYLLEYALLSIYLYWISFAIKQRIQLIRFPESIKYKVSTRSSVLESLFAADS